jgi:hypothetical protein
MQFLEVSEIRKNLLSALRAEHHTLNMEALGSSERLVHIVTDPWKSGPLPLSGRLVTDVISAVTNTDSYPITCNGWAKHCIRGNRYAL